VTGSRAPASPRAPGVLVRWLLAVCAIGWSLGWPPWAASPAAADPIVRYELPVDAAVGRGFEEPATVFGPGHRGVDLDARAGGMVGSAADGTVAHAGPVAGTTWVSVAHADGIVTSYGPLGRTVVRPGARVRRGQALGTLADAGHGLAAQDRGLHWGARRQGRYLDPMSLLEPGRPRPSLVGPGGWRGTAHVVTPYDRWSGASAGGWRAAPSPVATRPGFAVPPNPNHLLLVPGLGSSSRSVVTDPAHLGYDPRSVTSFSYAGRSTRGGAAGDPRRDQLPHGPEHTWPGVDAAARLLRDQLRAQAAREPGRAVDLVGHSMGGVVIWRYLSRYHDAYDRSLPPIGHVVTIASPLSGSDLAALAGDLDAHPVTGPLIAGAQGVHERSTGARGWVPLGAPAIADLRPGSPLLRELAGDVEHALHDGPAGALAMGTRVLTIGAGGDLVVGAYRTRVPRDPWVALERELARRSAPGAPTDASGRPATPPRDERMWQPWADGPPLEHRILPGGHSEVLRTEASREVLWRFLAGEEVVASPGKLAELTSEEGGTTIRVAGWLLRLHGASWGPLRRAVRPELPAPHP
jgi:hypothetical protein